MAKRYVYCADEDIIATASPGTTIYTKIQTESPATFAVVGHLVFLICFILYRANWNTIELNMYCCL